MTHWELGFESLQWAVIALLGVGLAFVSIQIKDLALLLSRLFLLVGKHALERIKAKPVVDKESLVTKETNGHS